jgi:Uma2 family endonuclease
LERGEVVEMSRAGEYHGVVCGLICALLVTYARQRKRGHVCINDTGVLVERDPDTVRGPDVLFFDYARSADEIHRKYSGQIPVLAVEVLSPNDSHGKIMRRVREQLKLGTRVVWVVDPEARNVAVYRAGQPEMLIETDEELSGVEELPGFSCKVADFFEIY